MNIEAAWAAGFFEGEGCVTRNNNKPKPSLALSVAQSHDRVDELRRFITAVGAGKVNGPYKDGKGIRQVWHVSITGKNAHKAMQVMLPYMTASSPKRRRYEELLGEVV